MFNNKDILINIYKTHYHKVIESKLQNNIFEHSKLNSLIDFYFLTIEIHSKGI